LKHFTESSRAIWGASAQSREIFTEIFIETSNQVT